MGKVNKSLKYILPLIEGWSAEADYPINSYANSMFRNALIVEYLKGNMIHDGEIIGENESSVFVKHQIAPEYLKDYELLMDGAYSRIRDRTKNIIISRTPKSSDSLNIERVLHKSKRPKTKLEQDLGVPDIDYLIDEYESKMFDEETFNINIHETTRKTAPGDRESGAITTA